MSFFHIAQIVWLVTVVIWFAVVIAWGISGIYHWGRRRFR